MEVAALKKKKRNRELDRGRKTERQHGKGTKEQKLRKLPDNRSHDVGEGQRVWE